MAFIETDTDYSKWFYSGETNSDEQRSAAAQSMAARRVAATRASFRWRKVIEDGLWLDQSGGWSAQDVKQGTGDVLPGLAPFAFAATALTRVLSLMRPIAE